MPLKVSPNPKSPITSKRKSHGNVNTARSILMNLLDKRVDVLRDEILLLYQRARGEGMGERFAHESMDLWVTFANDGPATICETPPVIEIALDKSPVAGSEIVYVFPRLRRVERQLVSARSEPPDLDITQ
ncbi:hypothetical protein XANCAGTX0491_007879 [Xanthoria calcicola]